MMENQVIEIITQVMLQLLTKQLEMATRDASEFIPDTRMPSG